MIAYGATIGLIVFILRNQLEFNICKFCTTFWLCLITSLFAHCLGHIGVGMVSALVAYSILEVFSDTSDLF